MSNNLTTILTKFAATIRSGAAAAPAKAMVQRAAVKTPADADRARTADMNRGAADWAKHDHRKAFDEELRMQGNDPDAYNMAYRQYDKRLQTAVNYGYISPEQAATYRKRVGNYITKQQRSAAKQYMSGFDSPDHTDADRAGIAARNGYDATRNPVFNFTADGRKPQMVGNYTGKTYGRVGNDPVSVATGRAGVQAGVQQPAAPSPTASRIPNGYTARGGKLYYTGQTNTQAAPRRAYTPPQGYTVRNGKLYYTGH